MTVESFRRVHAKNGGAVRRIIAVNARSNDKLQDEVDHARQGRYTARTSASSCSTTATRSSGASGSRSTRGSSRRAASSTAKRRSRRCIGSCTRRSVWAGARDDRRPHARLAAVRRADQWIKRDCAATIAGRSRSGSCCACVGRDCDVCLRADRASRVRRLALARLLGAARVRHRVQARRVPAGADRTVALRVQARPAARQGGAPAAAALDPLGGSAVGNPAEDTRTAPPDF